MPHEVTFETIRANCGLLHCENPVAQTESYHWLRSCKPFMSVVHAYRKQRFTIGEVARSLAPGGHTMQTSVMTGLLQEQLNGGGSQ